MKSASEMQNIIITINNNKKEHAPNSYEVSNPYGKDVKGKLGKYLLLQQNLLVSLLLGFNRFC